MSSRVIPTNLKTAVATRVLYKAGFPLLKQHTSGTDIPDPVKQEIIIGLNNGGP